MTVKASNLEYATAIRSVVAKMFIARGDGHIGGSYSIADVMAVIFNKYLREDPKDWFVLSKGHAGPSYYACLYLQNKIPEEALSTLNANGTILPSHPDRNLTPGVQCSTGSLGQGISQAVGIAYANKIKKTQAYVYCVVGDGELNEGETYEALEFASNKKLNNCIIFIDSNKKQVDGLIEEVSCAYNYEKLFEGLDLAVHTVAGNDVDEIDCVIKEIIDTPDEKCHVVVLDTVKGKGIAFFEEAENCHHVTFDEKGINELKKYVEENEGVVNHVLGITK